MASQDLEQSSAAPSSAAEQDDGAAGARRDLQAVAEADAAMPQQRGWQGACSADTVWTSGLRQGPASVSMRPGAGSRAPSVAHLPPPAGAAQAAASPGEQAPAPSSTAVAARARMARSLLSDAMKSAGSAGLSRTGSSHSQSSPGHSSLRHMLSDERQSPASSSGLAAASAQPPVAQRSLPRQLPAPKSASAVYPGPSSDEKQHGIQRGADVSRSRLLSGRRLSEGLHPAALRAAAAAVACGDQSEVEAVPIAHQQAGHDIQHPEVDAPLEQSQASPDQAPRSLGECPQGMQQGAEQSQAWLLACLQVGKHCPACRLHAWRSSCLTFWLSTVLLCRWVKAWEA